MIGTTALRSLLFALPITFLFGTNANAQIPEKTYVTYKDKEEIVRATREKDDWCTLEGSTTFRAAGKEYYALYKDCTSGLATTVVFIYAAEAVAPDQKWHLVYESKQFRGRVTVALNEAEQQVVFLSASMQQLMAVPVEQLGK